MVVVSGCWQALITLNPPPPPPPPLYGHPSAIQCTEGPSEFSTQSTEVQLATNGGQPLFALVLPMFALYLVNLLSLLWGPITNIYYYIVIVSFKGHTYNFQKSQSRFKFEWDLLDKYRLSWELFPFEVSLVARLMFSWELLMQTYWWSLPSVNTEACTSPHLQRLWGMWVWKFIRSISANLILRYHRYFLRSTTQ